MKYFGKWKLRVFEFSFQSARGVLRVGERHLTNPVYFPGTTLIWAGDSKMISGLLRYSMMVPLISTF